MYRENYINSLRTELLALVQEQLTPVAQRYGYSEVPLETNIKWRPQVLVLGNYSSGKSTLINELLGAEIQATGQAPTDDSFTVITYDDNAPKGAPIQLTEERDGKYLLHDPQYPFEALKRHGQRFASHFRLKKVNSPFLQTLAIIDTPGMHDSITERDRGYNYQDVIGDLSQLADLVLVLFDPHKAGTVREAHTSLRDTLPTRTFEDRVLFVLNRIDECVSLIDLLQVYGTLCWNLSQMTGRKDIPQIHLTYSPRAANENSDNPPGDAGYLSYLDNQREVLKKAILKAPRHRLDHLATFVETHSERLAHLLEALTNYRRGQRRLRLKTMFSGVLLSVLAGFGILVAGTQLALIPAGDFNQTILLGAAGALVLLLLWLLVVMPTTVSSYHRKALRNLDQLTPLTNQTRRDSWQIIRDQVSAYLVEHEGRFSYRKVRRDLEAVAQVFHHGSRDIREALNELASLGKDAVPQQKIHPLDKPRVKPPPAKAKRNI